MRLTIPLFARRSYSELDYARHFPKSYVARMKQTIPRKVYDNRFGAPAVIRWRLPPDDCSPTLTKRPWENSAFETTIERTHLYHTLQLNSKFFQKRINTIKKIPDDEWTIFPGDRVQIMVGPDRGKQDDVSHVIRDMNAVFVSSCHRKFVQMIDEEMAKKLESDSAYKWEEQPLFVDKNQVSLVDPGDKKPCAAKWILNDIRTGYDRISTRSGLKIPLPSRAYVTYEYMDPKTYIEVIGKDTPAKDALEVTYEPKLCTFEENIEEVFGYEKRSVNDEHKTFWY